MLVSRPNLTPMRLLHLSDLHFGPADQAESQARRWLSQLAEDLTRELRCSTLDGLIMSGDIANVSEPEEYIAAAGFVRNLMEEFGLTSEQVVIVPGNHDLNWDLSEQSYRAHKRKHYQDPLQEGCYIDAGDYIEVRDDSSYPARFRHFAKLYQDIVGQAYPLAYENQATLHHFPKHDLLVIGFNSAWQLDHHFKTRANIHPEAVSQVLSRIRKSPTYDRCSRKMAVWHHPLHGAGEDRIKDHGFLEQLAKAGFRIALHGHIHKADASLYCYDRSAGGRRIDIVAAGTFGAPVREWVPGYPLQYNLLRIEGDTITVETRKREEPNGAWKPDARWTQGAGNDPLPRYRLALAP